MTRLCSLFVLRYLQKLFVKAHHSRLLNASRLRGGV